MARAAIAEIILGFGIGVLPADGNSSDARRREPRGDIGGDVEHRMTGAGGGEKTLVGRIVGGEARHETVVDFIGGAADARADRSGDMGAAGAEAFHRRERTVS